MDSTTKHLAAGGCAGASSVHTPPLPAMLAGALSGAGAGGGEGDPLAALQRLAALGDRMAAVRRVLAASISGESQPLSPSDIQSVSSEISSAAHLVIVNAASLLSFSLPFPAPSLPPAPIQEVPAAVSSAQGPPQEATKGDGGYDVVELDAAELLAEHVHFCNICGKGFRRDANLRMHMRAHGDRFKTLDALSRPGQAKPAAGRDVRFSCPFAGCNRNRAHRRFRPLKSAVCARNHFRRSHCPKLYACDRCGGKKRFAVLADLRSHLRHCGEEAQWRCSCGTTFSRKDKLFGHLALFEGHMPAISAHNKDAPTEAPLDIMDEEGIDANCDQDDEADEGSFDQEFFKEWMEELKDGAGGTSWPGTAAAEQ